MKKLRIVIPVLTILTAFGLGVAYNASNTHAQKGTTATVMDDPTPLDTPPSPENITSADTASTPPPKSSTAPQDTASPPDGAGEEAETEVDTTPQSTTQATPSVIGAVYTTPGTGNSSIIAP